MTDREEGQYQGPDPDKHGTGPAPRENEREGRETDETTERGEEEESND